MKIKLAVILLGMMSMLFATGCGPNRSNIKKMYTGENLPYSQLATLTSPGTAIKVVSINGEKIGTFPYKNVFELLPGDYTLELYLSYYKVREGNKIEVKKGLGTVKLSFTAKQGFDYFINLFEFFAKGKEIYSFPYEKLSSEGDSIRAMACRDKLSINWIPEGSDFRWYPFIFEYGQQYNISKHVVDWRYKGIAKLLPETAEKEFNHISSLIEKQQNLVTDCMGDDSKEYFTNTKFYKFPLKFY